MANEAYFVDGGNYVAEELRRFLKTFYYSPDALGGVISGGTVVQGVGSTVKVKAVSAFVLDAGGGAYVGATQADSDPITITPTSTGDRTDTIYAIMNDPGSGGSAGEMAFGRVSASFTIPSLAIPLAHVTAHNDGSLTIADVRVQVQTASSHSDDTGWVPVDLLNGWTHPTGVGYVGQLLLRRRGKECQLLGTIRQPWDTPSDSGDDPGLGTYWVAALLPAWATPLYTNEFDTHTNAMPNSLQPPFRPVAWAQIEGSAAGQYSQGSSGVSHPGRVSIFMPNRNNAVVGGPYWASLSHKFFVE